jgi:hypothetical protein
MGAFPLFQRDRSGSAIRLIAVEYYMRIPSQYGMNHAALNPQASSMNDADFAIALQSRLIEIVYPKPATSRGWNECKSIESSIGNCTDSIGFPSIL